MIYPDEIHHYGAVRLAAMIAARELGAAEVCEAFLRRIERFDGELHAFLTVDPSYAISQAKDADRRAASGEHLGALHGVPVAVKDLEETIGLKTTFGAEAYRENAPHSDSLLVRRLRGSGAIILGKTNTPAFGLLGETKNRLGKATANPWRMDHVPGGSSGGSAACVSAGMAPLATGTDTAGSITGPAAMCGTFGFKPTLGLVPIHPNGGDSLSFNAAGPISRNVPDAALFLNAVAGFSLMDPIALKDRPIDFLAELESALGPLRLGFSPDLGRFAVDEEVADLCRAGATALAESGCTLSEVQIHLPDPWDAYLPIYLADTALSVSKFTREHPGELFPETIAEIDEAERISPADVARALNARHVFRARVERIFHNFDLLITPATATTAFPMSDPPDTIGGRSVEPGWRTFMPFSVAWNLAGNPTASVPVGTTQAGLPVGMMLIGRSREDITVLRAALALESTRPWGAPPFLDRR